MQLWDQPAPELAPRARANAALLGRAGLRELMSGLDEAAWRGDQVFEGLYKHRLGTWEEFTNLSKGLRTKLANAADITWPEIVQSVPSRDGSTKHAFRLADGKEVEGVHMPYANRTTLCLSSQVGCAMGCTFCATGQMGILRNLLPGEITGQVVSMLRRHGAPVGSDGEPDPLNIVFMGMGEPMHNLDNLMASFETLTDATGLSLSPKRITVSTSGLVTGIDRLGAFKKRPRLAVSLNGTTDEYRSKIMPVNRVWNLEALTDALARFPLQTNERITLEYVLLKGVTDSIDDGRRLVALASRFPSKVNLIPFNPHEGSGFEPPDEGRVSELCRLLADEGVIVSVRRSRGQDVAGACGQLARPGQSRRPPGP
ncbi:MAG TPA: 23S rRNA (adenine(2503)-C(2))-methyltransferase RlmN [Holophagaceae bacterium]|jgi:23S rRNA (adenine2503-C2)-methyltransferase|nr:23S rRNA (adenine(2503)-C(2))-methyltransferase RlmN [Holophagaceae bacterium]